METETEIEKAAITLSEDGRQMVVNSLLGTLIGTSHSMGIGTAQGNPAAMSLRQNVHLQRGFIAYIFEQFYLSSGEGSVLLDKPAILTIRRLVSDELDELQMMRAKASATDIKASAAINDIITKVQDNLKCMVYEGWKKDYMEAEKAEKEAKDGPHIILP